MFGSGRLFRGLKSFTQGFLIGVPICLTFTDNFFSICRVEGISMQPILNSDARRNDFVLISRWKAKRFDRIEKGDIVSIVSPNDPNTALIKRIIALEGDTVRTIKYKNRNVKVPRGHCWIEGDNHNHSLDSNSFGSVPLGLVNGVATTIVWPPSRWGKLCNQVPINRNDFDNITELENDETELLGNQGNISIISDSPSSLTNNNTNELNSNIDSVNAALSKPTSGKEKIGSGNLLTHLPQNALRHASEITSIHEKEQ